MDNFNKDDSHKTGKDLTIEYLKNDVEILDYCMNEYVKLGMKEFSLNPLHYVSLPGYSFDCWLMSSGVTLDTLQDKQMLDDFVEAKRGGICRIMGDRYINGNSNNISNNNSKNNSDNNSNNNGETWTKSHSNENSNNNRRSRFTDSNSNRLIWYIYANNLYGYAMMQKLPYSTSLDTILNTPDDSDHGYYIVCDINYTNSCKDRTDQLALMPNKRNINDGELGYLRSSYTDIERERERERELGC